MKQARLWLAGGLCLVIIGLILGATPFLQYWRGAHNKVTHSPFTSVVHANPATTEHVAPQVAGKPVRIQIPSLRLDLPVIDGYYNQQSKTWTLTKDKVQYATITPESNTQEGNTFLYGHNRPGVFATLHNVQPGAEVIITTANGHTFTYKYRSAYETNPNDDSLFHYQGAPILTVQTCSGIWYQNRQLFVFDLVSAT